MWAVAAVGVISLIAMVLMIQTAIAVGFTVLIVPLVVLELLLLAGLYALWRGLGGGEGASEAPPRPTPVRPASPVPRTMQRRRPMPPAANLR